MVVKIKNSTLDGLGFLLIVVTYFLSYIIVNNSHELIIFLGMTIFIGFVALFKTQFKIKMWKNLYFPYIILFAFFCYLSSKWAMVPSIAVGKGNTIVEILLLMFVICMFVRELNDPVDLFLKVIMWGGVLIVLYSIWFFGLSGLRQVFESESRLDNSLININNIGMSASYSILICVYYIMNDRVRLWNILILPCLVMLAASGSRKAILIVVLGVLMIYVMKNIDNKNALLSLLKIVIIIFVLGVVFFLMLQFPIFADLKRRMLSMFAALTGDKANADNSALTRIHLIDIGNRIFRNNAIHGIGIDNARIVVKNLLGKDNYYLHNNYIEMLADGGIVGFVLYYSIYAFLLIRFIMIRDFKNQQFNICAALLVVNLIIEYGAVTYIYKHTYMFLMVFMLQYEQSTKRRFNLQDWFTNLYRARKLVNAPKGRC